MTVNPAQAAFPISVSTPLYLLFTIGPAVAAYINMKVPTNSAPICYTFQHWKFNVNFTFPFSLGGIRIAWQWIIF